MTMERKSVSALGDMRNHDEFEVTWPDLCSQKDSVAIKTGLG